DLIPPKRRGEGMGYFGLSGNMALGFGPALGLSLAGVISFSKLFLVCAGLGLIAFLLASQLKYRKVEKLPDKTTRVRFDIFEKTAHQPSLLLFFITVTFSGIATYLPLYAIEKNIHGIE